MKKIVLFCLFFSSTNLLPQPKPKNHFLEVLGHIKMLTGFALIPMGMIAAAYSDADHHLYKRLEPAQRKDLSIFAPIEPAFLFWGSIWCGITLMAWGANDVQESKKSLEENNSANLR